MQRFLARAQVGLQTSWGARLEGLGRDLRMLFGGTSPSPIIRAGRASGPAPAPGGRWLTVTEVVQETADAVTLVFERELDAWVPGQFLTVYFDVAGERLRRAYSLCTRPADQRGPAITIKRIPDGRVSSALVADARPGLRLEVRGPSGQFVLPPRVGPRHVVLVGGGSGITPLIGLAEEVLAQSDRATLIYGNRALPDVIFFERLGALSAASDGRLTVQHVLESAPARWSGGTGRLDAVTLEGMLGALPRPADLIFSCGPAPMMQALRDALAALGIDQSVLHEERFQSLAEHRAESLPSTAQALRITLGERTVEVLARPGATVLEAGLAAGLPMPYSCTMGGCGACRVKLEGRVVHDTPNGLSAEEVALGYAFACIARPLGACTIEVPS